MQNLGSGFPPPVRVKKKENKVACSVLIKTSVLEQDPLFYKMTGGVFKFFQNPITNDDFST